MVRSIACSLLMVGCLLITACAPTDQGASPDATDQVPDDATAQPASADVAPEALSTHTITDALGQQIDVPIEPQRVITMSEQDLDAALALDVIPVASVNGRGQTTLPTYLGEQTDGIESVGSFVEPSLEKIAALDPDLILMGGIFPRIEELLPQLGEIAPVVVTYNLEDDWKTAFIGTATALNRVEQAEAFLSTYDQEVQDVAAAFSTDVSAEASIIRWSPEGPIIMSYDSFGWLVAQDLGLERPEAQESIVIQPGHMHSEPLSLEQLDQIDADWMFIGTLNPDGLSALENAERSPLFQQLSAAQNNQVVEVDGTIWTSRGGPLAALIVLEDVRTALTDA